MIWNSQNKSDPLISQMVERITSSGQLSRQEYLLLTSVILSNYKDYKLTDEERRQVTRVFDSLQTNRVKIIDQ